MIRVEGLPAKLLIIATATVVLELVVIESSWAYHARDAFAAFISLVFLDNAALTIWIPTHEQVLETGFVHFQHTYDRWFVKPLLWEICCIEGRRI